MQGYYLLDLGQIFCSDLEALEENWKGDMKETRKRERSVCSGGACVCVCVCVCALSGSVGSDSLPPYGLWLAGSSVHGIFPARTLEWVAISSSRGSS